MECRLDNICVVKRESKLDGTLLSYASKYMTDVE